MPVEASSAAKLMADFEPLVEAFLQQSPACYCILDASGVFVRAWGDCAGFLGRGAGELLSRRLDAVLSADGARSWSSRLARTIQGEVLHMRERSGEGTWNVSMFPIRLDGEIRYAGAVAREITPWNKAEQELRNTVLGALKAQEFERNMVSRFLHDNVGQNLTALGLQLDLIRMDLEEAQPAICARIAEIQRLLEEMMESVREYSYELNPSTVERAGLRPALDRLAVRIRERFQGSLRINVDPSLKIEKRRASAMYQIAQEAAENAVQHSSCSAIEIAIKSSRTGTFLEVRDNGRGFDPGELGGRRGLGLLSMEHHAAQAGLNLSISSQPGQGTIIRAASPEAV